MREIADDELYARGAATLLASWEEYARASDGATVEHLEGVSAAVFPRGPGRGVYNNALLERDLGPRRSARAVDALEAAYRSAGVDSYAAWVHESDDGMRAELAGRGYTIDEVTRAMGLALDDIALPPPAIELVAPSWPEYVAFLQADGVPAGLLDDADPGAFHTLAARLGADTVATALAFDHEDDCGVFNVSTVESARRRGLGSALTARLVHDARTRGCRTATLQSTGMAERIYASLGFRDLGRFLEYVPGDAG
jgi:ribosomal protein S18 acetylase RimI-like enzyme